MPPRLIAADQSAQQRHELREDICEKRPLAVAAILAVAHVYWYRHGKTEDRAVFWDELGWKLSGEYGRTINKTCFASLIVPGQDTSTIPFAQTVLTAQERFCSQIQVEQGIAMNDALSENLFVVIVCILSIVLQQKDRTIPKNNDVPVITIPERMYCFMHYE